MSGKRELIELWSSLGGPFKTMSFENRKQPQGWFISFGAIIDVLNTPISLPFLTGKRSSTNQNLSRFWNKREQNKKVSAAVSAKPALVTLFGEVGLGRGCQYCVDGFEFDVTSNTCLVGDLVKGAKARVKISIFPGHKPHAKSVVITSPAKNH